MEFEHQRDTRTTEEKIRDKLRWMSSHPHGFEVMFAHARAPLRVTEDMEWDKEKPK